ncbi:MAG TPA: TPM domain-containing protein [Caulobacteraceae bacterium]|nr:TPM domain-containing protein [Caulobacteraceae bacterium]
MVNSLTELDRERIAAAVEQAEAGTSGEIVCAITGEVSRYREVPIAWATAIALGLPPFAAALGLKPLALAFAVSPWIAAQASAVQAELALAIWGYATAQITLFVLVAIIVATPAVRRLATPRVLKRHRVEHAARHQFAAIAAHATDSDTGVLIFVAVIDRQVQILADAAIHAKCGEQPWKEAAGAIVAAMKSGRDPTAGIVRAVEICGAALEAHFPADTPPDHRFAAGPVEV